MSKFTLDARGDIKRGTLVKNGMINRTLIDAYVDAFAFVKAKSSKTNLQPAVGFIQDKYGLKSRPMFLTVGNVDKVPQSDFQNAKEAYAYARLLAYKIYKVTMAE